MDIIFIHPDKNRHCQQISDQKWREITEHSIGGITTPVKAAECRLESEYSTKSRGKTVQLISEEPTFESN